MKKFADGFKNVESKYRGMPFWAWNGKLDREEIKRQVRLMREMGFGGFFIHSRVGLVTEYLGEEWFDCVKTAVDEAEKYGIFVYIYDEDRWPSGSCGGMVTMIPRFRQKSLTVKLMSASEFSFSDCGQNFVRAFAVSFNENILCDYFVYDLPRPLPAQYQIAVVSITEMALQDFYNGFTYLDTLNLEATEHFLQLTHEKYKERFGELFGNKIVGFFTDEVHHGALFSGFNLTNKDRFSMCPWTYHLFDVFATKYGYRLEDRLPELFFQGKEVFSKVAYEYNEVVEEMFIDNFIKPYSDWCARNNLILTGHILHEDSLGAQASCCGSAARIYEYWPIPGVDVLSEHNMSYWIAKQVVSVSRQMGYKRTLSELYGCTGWDFTFEGHRNVGAWQAVQGINFRCHHLSWYTMKGESKRDYPASIFYQSAWYKDYHHIEDFFSRIGYITSECESVCEVGVITPVESLWGLAHIGWINLFDPTEKEGIRIEKIYADTYRKLTNHAVDFDYIDEDILSRRGYVENDLCVGEACYKRIVVRGLLNIRKSTLDLLDRFSKEGGEVYWVGELPRYVDGIHQEIAPCGIIVEYLSDTLIDKLAGEGVRIKASGDIMKGVYKRGEDLFVLALNSDREKGLPFVEISVRGRYSVEEWVADTGNIVPVMYRSGQNYTEVNVDFEAGELKIFHFTKKKVESACAVKKSFSSVELPEFFEYKLAEENICVLDSAVCFYQGIKTDKKEVLKIETEIREKYGMHRKNGDMIQPWFLDKFCRTERRQIPIVLEYPFYIESIPQRVDLVIEECDAQIEINGKMLTAECAKELWIDNCFLVFPLNVGVLKIGKNVIRISYSYNEQRNIEAVYLKGDFGVRIRGAEAILIDLPQKLKVGDICEQGLPFYSGKISYRVLLPEGNYRISLPKTYAAVNYLRSGENEIMVAYPPYRGEIFVNDILWIDCVFTRRNTFGPLHHYPKHRGVCGAEHFYTTGDQYTADYQVIEQGLLEPPIIEKEKSSR